VQAGGDFGVGWTLEVKAVRRTTNGQLGDDWTGTLSPGFIPTYCVQESKPHVISAILSDGTVYDFKPSLTDNCQQLFPPEFVTLGFAPTGTTPSNASLTALGVDLQPFVLGSFPGPITLLDFNDVSTVDPDQYQ